MKKLITIIALLITLTSSALELKIHASDLAVGGNRPGQEKYIDIDIIDRTRTGFEVVTVYIYHQNFDFTYSDTIELRSVFITDLVKNEWPQYKGYKRITFNLPETFPYGGFVIKVTYGNNEVGHFMLEPLVVFDEILEEKKNGAIYFDMNGSKIEKPVGLCIEIVGNIRRKVFIKGI